MMPHKFILVRDAVFVAHCPIRLAGAWWHINNAPDGVPGASAAVRWSKPQGAFVRQEASGGSTSHCTFGCAIWFVAQLQKSLPVVLQLQLSRSNSRCIPSIPPGRTAKKGGQHASRLLMCSFWCCGPCFRGMLPACYHGKEQQRECREQQRAGSAHGGAKNSQPPVSLSLWNRVL